MGIGIPASGKTTVLKKFAEKYGYDYICPDDLRLEMYGKIEYKISSKDNSWKIKNKEVWEEVRERVKESLVNGNTVVLDAVFNDPKKRKDFFDFVKENGAEKIQGIYVDTPIEVAKERNREKERRVPEQIIDKIAADFEEVKPKIEEGFDSMFTVDEYQNLVASEIKMGEGSLKKEFK